ncbi:hypothetical protein [Nonomuraea sp. LPB2021202275-12-8]|uniref:hypothetical protein n=1 Tax=Nonomuraea sp. LPB2021202275-12-8 TaxID=3120159 RepID=UPI00300C2BE8
MPTLPTRLIIALTAVSVTSFTFSLYLEIFHLNLLQEHPVMVNLLSGIVGFSTATVVIGVGFNRYTKKHATDQVLACHSDLQAVATEMLQAAPKEFWKKLPQALAGRLMDAWWGHRHARPSDPKEKNPRLWLRQRLDKQMSVLDKREDSESLEMAPRVIQLCGDLERLSGADRDVMVIRAREKARQHFFDVKWYRPFTPEDKLLDVAEYYARVCTHPSVATVVGNTRSHK